MSKYRWIGVVVAAALALGALPLSSATGGIGEMKRYIVVFDAEYAVDGTYALGGSYALNHQYALELVKAAGGTVVNDMSKEIAVMVVDSPNALFADVMRSSALVDSVAEEFVWKAFPSYEEAIDTGQLTLMHPGESLPGGGPEVGEEPLEAAQWNMEQIRAPEANAKQAGSPLVEVGILDTGIDGAHLDFVDALQPGDPLPTPAPGSATNVNCEKGKSFTILGSPFPCTDDNFHGTHVAGIVGARVNNHGVRGVAPNVELIPVKVCDLTGHCYSSATVSGITYAGQMKFEVINMSFFVDDDFFLESTEFKCSNDPVQSTFRKANERAIQYARNQGVVPVAALGNSDTDLAHPPQGNECEVVPAETQGVIGTMALGPSSEKARYSNYGVGMTDVAAPGGNSRNPRGELGPLPCGTQVPSTIPGQAWGCFQGTSMASPHTAGVAALIVSQYGRVGTDAGETDVVMRPQEVENYLQSTTVDLYSIDPTTGKESLKGYDGCFGNGRIDAVKAVNHDTSTSEPEDRHAVEAPVERGCPTFR